MFCLIWASVDSCTAELVAHVSVHMCEMLFSLFCLEFPLVICIRVVVVVAFPLFVRCFVACPLLLCPLLVRCLFWPVWAFAGLCWTVLACVGLCCVVTGCSGFVLTNHGWSQIVHALEACTLGLAGCHGLSRAVVSVLACVGLSRVVTGFHGFALISQGL